MVPSALRALEVGGRPKGKRRPPIATLEEAETTLAVLEMQNSKRGNLATLMVLPTDPRGGRTSGG